MLFCSIRKAWFTSQGLTIGNTTLPKISVSWPHKVKIGNACVLEEGILFKHDGIWSEGKSIVVGDRKSKP